MEVSDPEGGRSYEIELDVRWCDQDHLGHVNHIVAVSYLAEARVRWLARDAVGLGLVDFEASRVVVSLTIDYVDAMYAGTPVTVAMQVTRIGTKSYTITYRVSQEGRAAMTAATTVVTLAPDGRTRPVTDSERNYLARFQVNHSEIHNKVT